MSWFAKKQGGLSLSTTEAEFTAVSVVVTQMLGLRELLGEIGVKCRYPMVLYVDNQAAFQHLIEYGASAKLKHVDVRIKYVSSHAKSGMIAPSFLISSRMPANLVKNVVPAPIQEEINDSGGIKQNVIEME